MKRVKITGTWLRASSRRLADGGAGEGGDDAEGGRADDGHCYVPAGDDQGDER
jgi:hypothetical protein